MLRFIAALLLASAVVRAEVSTSRTEDLLSRDIETTLAAVDDGAGWQFEVALYAWVPFSVEGSSTIAGQRAPLDLDLDDILDILEGAMSAHFEARKGRWGFSLDVAYTSLEISGAIGPVSVDVDIQQWVADVGVSYMVLDRSAAPRPWWVEVFLGPVYNDLKQEVTLTPGPTVGGSRNWVDLAVAARLRTALTRDEKWWFVVRGGLGGFGIGSGSDLVAAFGIGVARRISADKEIRFGWELVDFDYSRGGAADEFALDATMHGVYFAFAFQF